jgi:iron complex transport system substrate-binding protein
MFTEMLRFRCGPARIREIFAAALPAVCLLLVSVLAQAGTSEHEHGDPELAMTPKRVVTLDWAATEALLLLGVTPVGVADRDGYPIWVREPALPPGSYDVGARRAPSLEAIAELKADLIVSSGQLVPSSVWHGC